MLFRFGASGAIPVFRFDRWWTIFSAGWLHGGLLHIFFNMLWVRQLAPETAELYGAGPHGHHLHGRPVPPASRSAR